MPNFTPIGIVHNNITKTQAKGWASVVSEIVLDERYTEALDGIEDYSHALIVFWFDRSEPPRVLKENVQGRKELPVVGIFARRGPVRPNAIAVTAVPIISRDGNILRVKRLDAIDGTPLLDIKPYTPAFDRVDDARSPAWSKIIYEDENYF